MTTHCQICGRDIKAKTGLIAHHGYQRPGQGWQTASCFGARYRPYEVACDALPKAIESAQAWVDHTEAKLKAWIETPPETISWFKRDGWNKVVRGSEAIVSPKPADFDPTGGLYGRDAYTIHYVRTKSDWTYGIRETKAAIEDLKKRLSEWKPSTTENAA